MHTGAGKGKSTAAVLRVLGHGWRVGVVQFIKGAWETGEREAFARFRDQMSWHTMGEGFTWETQDKERDIAAAQAAWVKARELMADPGVGLLILDELNIALRYDYLPLAEVVEALTARRPELTVVVTGRNAKPELIALADCVTEMGALTALRASRRGLSRSSGRGTPAFRRVIVRRNKNLEPLSFHRTRISSRAYPLLMEVKSGLYLIVLSCVLSENRFTLFRTHSKREKP